MNEAVYWFAAIGFLMLVVIPAIIGWSMIAAWLGGDISLDDLLQRRRR